MIDGNTHALMQYERAQEKASRIEYAFEAEIGDLLKQITELAESVKHTAMHYEDNYSLDFDWEEYVHQAVRDAS